MKTSKIVIIVVPSKLWFAIAVYMVIFCLPLSADDFQDTKAKIAQASSVLGSLHSWDVPSLDTEQQQAVIQLREAALQLIRRPDYSTTLPPLLASYKDQDNYARQALFYALIQKRDYAGNDLPFLKGVFVASLHFHYDEPGRRVRDWLDDIYIRLQLGNLILGASGQSEMIGKDNRLLYRDPAAWLAKYTP